MPPELINILVQLPVVGLFAWFMERKDRQFMEFLREERQARAAQMDKLEAALTERMHELQATLFDINRKRGGD